MDVFRYYIAIPSIRTNDSIKKRILMTSWMTRPYAVDKSDITYYPNVFALVVL